ncbi:acetyl/propionyl/methylcrotonyl-CoA carboxylase subunit alpha [Pediococcus acidilactici]|uniref:acetyl-CoA carboxylase biotin carboxylase subunit n=1 Tax=Pediococcus acidilactici TaxID=1254 RepID=UPI003A95AD95
MKGGLIIIKRILVANRGEIAVRIIRACHEMNIEAIAVYSKADKNSLFVRLADDAVEIGPSPVTKSYLNKQSILMAATLKQVDAIHPGYGLLSEDWVFAKLCEEMGFEFIGPKSETIKKMGNKVNARQIMSNAGVDVVPGAVLESIEKIEKLNMSFPLMVKSALGGGGKGIRKVANKEALQSEIDIIRKEAANSFGGSKIYIEQFMQPARHIEVQIAADKFGHTFAISERDCSLQRRHQKVIEQAPATILTEEQRKQIEKQAIIGAETICYKGLGTMEFLLYKGSIFFLEMNTRLQVEHTVTEEISDIDLVKLQIQIANGENIADLKDQLSYSGVALECRLTSENYKKNFIASTGKITDFYVPTGGKGVRIDEGVKSGDIVTPYYDSLLAKIIVHDNSREKARIKMLEVLNEIAIEGIDTNLNLLKRILNNDLFVKDKISTTSIEEEIL